MNQDRNVILPCVVQRSCQQLTDIYEVNLEPGSVKVPNFAETVDSCYSSCVTQPSPSPSYAGQRKGQQQLTQPSPSPFGECESQDVEKLYVDVMHSLLNMIGCDADRDNQFKMIEHLRKAFKFEPKEHLQLYECAMERPKPKLKLHLSVIEARDLVNKDISGTNDPFVTFYLKSDPKACFNTSCKVKTETPSWDESFVLTLDESTDLEDVLHLDVWNFCPDEKFK